MIIDILSLNYTAPGNIETKAAYLTVDQLNLTEAYGLSTMAEACSEHMRQVILHSTHSYALIEPEVGVVATASVAHNVIGHDTLGTETHPTTTEIRVKGHFVEVFSPFSLC